MKAEDVVRVLVVGAGTMGQQIALQCAGHGLAVVILDSDPQALTRAQAQLTGLGRGIGWRPRLRRGGSRTGRGCDHLRDGSCDSRG